MISTLSSEGYTCYFTDTDSLSLDKPLTEGHPFLGKELGQFPLEGV